MEYKLGDRFVLKSNATEYVLEEIGKHKEKGSELIVCNPVEKSFNIVNSHGVEIVVQRDNIRMSRDNFNKVIEAGIIKQIK